MQYYTFPFSPDREDEIASGLTPWNSMLAKSAGIYLPVIVLLKRPPVIDNWVTYAIVNSPTALRSINEFQVISFDSIPGSNLSLPVLE